MPLYHPIADIAKCHSCRLRERSAAGTTSCHFTLELGPTRDSWAGNIVTSDFFFLKSRHPTLTYVLKLYTLTTLDLSHKIRLSELAGVVHNQYMEQFSGPFKIATNIFCPKLCI
jgi:hypothetical protein